MKDQFQTWLDHKSNPAGVLGAGLVYPDKSCISKMFTDVCDEANFDLILTALAGTLQLAQQQKWPGTRFRLSFEQYSIHCAFRRDRCCLALLTEPQLSLIANTSVDRLFDEFQSL